MPVGTAGRSGSVAGSVLRRLAGGATRAASLAVVAGLAVAATGAEPQFVFRNRAREAGLIPAAAGIQGHAAGWGDVDGDGWVDLYVGTFETPEHKPNLLFRNRQGRFALDEQDALKISTRATGTLFADLDNDGDLDLYVSSMPIAPDSKGAQRLGRPCRGCTLFRNDGGGKYVDVSAGNGACPDAFGGRSATVLDIDGDGLLDLLVGEDPVPGYNGSKTKSSRLFRNRGGLKFADVSRESGIPEGVPGLGVAAGDLNGDGAPDFFLASPSGGNLLFLNDGKGKFREAPGSRESFAWPTSKGDDMVCGVVFGDVNADGLPDVVLGQHYSRPWVVPVANRLYLHRGTTGGVPKFEDVTEKAGLTALPMKSPHVEIQDFDNDGRPDISTSLVKLVPDGHHPVVFRNLGVQADGLPRFKEDALAVNDFPTDEDKKVARTGEFFTRMIERKKVIYMAPGPSADYDNDGRLDFFLPNWWVESESLLLHNETPGGHWVQVQVEGPKGVSRQGVGSLVRVFAAGKLGDKSALLGTKEIGSGYGYASAQPAIAHFGLGAATKVDVEVVLPFGQGRLEKKDVAADQRITLGP